MIKYLLIAIVTIAVPAVAYDKIRAYKSVCGGSIGELNDSVNSYIDEGWQPYGSISVSGIPKETISHCQAMVKYWPTKTPDIETTIVVVHTVTPIPVPTTRAASTIHATPTLTPTARVIK